MLPFRNLGKHWLGLAEDTPKSRSSLPPGVPARGSKRSHTGKLKKPAVDSLAGLRVGDIYKLPLASRS